MIQTDFLYSSTLKDLKYVIELRLQHSSMESMDYLHCVEVRICHVTLKHKQNKNKTKT